MDTLTAIVNNQAARLNGATSRTFDWVEAARILREKGAREAEAGLAGDWEWTGGLILTDGEIDRDSYTYLTSSWARPMLRIGAEEIECWRFLAEGEIDSAESKWPEDAVKAFKGA